MTRHRMLYMFASYFLGIVMWSAAFALNNGWVSAILATIGLQYFSVGAKCWLEDANDAKTK